MNKRIRELYDQCIVGRNNDAQWIFEGDLDPEKFAELIARECGEIARHHTLSRSGHKGKEEEFTGTVDLQEEILKHFGIKNQKMIKDKEYTGVVKIYRVTDVFYRVRAKSVPQAKKKMIDSARMEDWDDLVWDDPYAYEIDTVELEVKCSPVNE